MNTFYVFICAAVSFLKKLFGVRDSLIPTAVGMGVPERPVVADELVRRHSVTVYSTEQSPDTQEITDAVASENTAANVKENLSENVTDTSRSLGPIKTKNQAAAAREFVRNALRDAPMPFAAINQAAEKAGFTPNQLRRAADKVGVVRKKLPGMRTGWSWSLPAVNAVDNSSDFAHGSAEIEVA